MTRTIMLNDERILAVRPIRREDAPRLQDFHRSHCPQTRYQRFFGHYPELSDEQAAWFAGVDGHDRLALVAIDPENPEKFAGVVRLDRDRAPRQPNMRRSSPTPGKGMESDTA